MPSFPPPHRNVRALHICSACGQEVPVDVHEFVAGARVCEDRVEWFCERHRESPASGHVWIDCPAAPYYGD